ncbi:cytochrome-c oxidase, cbb3-type subunit II [Rubrivirga sp. S365]|uniref:Cytochrome-c oxidase, cbb3-type subunit II n=1 Tax=Rubrivirga litoralis TaxID=3075598 RepID=A0ABU3BNI1_9BACT|nr:MULTISPECIES: cytochrome-c oxidase, cbb3-type subunit II [unclassified Rubrivirga]MDT0630844.1 cytochrome-c oxidase, cbb3-type subunit II [Rubrivirga sp. F394]MDT7857396.1 cytochrome-c oxidase, cbb3-type subunit II [Rubrivirga sp. S365]
MKRFFRANGAHRRLEGWPLVFTVLTTVAILVGTVVEFAPLFLVGGAVEPLATLEPYTPLELVGRDVYIAEGCNNCHSQQIRPFQDEVIRYGPYSVPEEGAYETPHLWGSKRTGPDLARVGGKYPHLWHVRHMDNPRNTSPRSIMPPYPHMLTKRLDLDDVAGNMRGLRRLGVPYTDAEIENAAALAHAQAEAIAAEVESQGGPEGLSDREIMAVVAYLQRLGVDRARALDPDLDRGETELEAHEVREIEQTVLPPERRPPVLEDPDPIPDPAP